MKLDGWHRLWIVACAIYLVAVGVFFAARWPKLEDIRETFREELAPESRAKLSSPPVLDPKEFPECIKLTSWACFRAMMEKSPVDSRAMPNRDILYFSLDSTTPGERDKIADEYLAILKSENLKRKGQFLLYAGLWWIIPCVLVYVAGSSIGWIYAGFKSR